MRLFYSENYLLIDLNEILQKTIEQKNFKLSSYESSVVLFTHFIFILKCYLLLLVFKNTNISKV